MTSSTSTARSRLFVALDLPTVAEAEAIVARLGASVTAYKIGLEQMFATGGTGDLGGLGLARALKARGADIFLDLKLLDIPNTVAKATANIAGLGLDYLTVHGVDRKTLDAAVKGRGQSPLKLLAVTVLTSLDALDLAEQGIVGETASSLVVRRALMAKAAGFDGVIASGREAAAVRAATGPGFLIVTPGIRLADPAAAGWPVADATRTATPRQSMDDQARVTTPTDAIAAGATHLVVGRPITTAIDPAAAARAIIAEIEGAATVAHAN